MGVSKSLRWRVRRRSRSPRSALSDPASGSAAPRTAGVFRARAGRAARRFFTSPTTGHDRRPRGQSCRAATCSRRSACGLAVGLIVAASTPVAPGLACGVVLAGLLSCRRSPWRRSCRRTTYETRTRSWLPFVALAFAGLVALLIAGSAESLQRTVVCPRRSQPDPGRGAGSVGSGYVKARSASQGAVQWRSHLGRRGRRPGDGGRDVRGCVERRVALRQGGSSARLPRATRAEPWESRCPRDGRSPSAWLEEGRTRSRSCSGPLAVHPSDHDVAQEAGTRRVLVGPAQGLVGRRCLAALGRRSRGHPCFAPAGSEPGRFGCWPSRSLAIHSAGGVASGLPRRRQQGLCGGAGLLPHRAGDPRRGAAQTPQQPPYHAPVEPEPASDRRGWAATEPK